MSKERYPQHEKAEWAVDRARDWLQKRNLSVSIPNRASMTGPDLIVSKPGKKVIRIEVKLCFFNKGAWRINRVTRKKDDFIAIVFPCGQVQLEQMKDHLRLTNKSGDRFVTSLGRLLE